MYERIVELSAPLSPDIPVAEATANSDSMTSPIMPDHHNTRGRTGYFGLDKGDMSNIVTLLIMIIGICMKMWLSSWASITKYIVAFGLFGFAGGITNWLAVKMLFDRIPGLVGSGVIPRQYLAIRRSVKDVIMTSFFDSAYLKTYIEVKSKDMMRTVDIAAQIRSALEQPGMDETIVKKLEVMAEKPEGAMLNSFAQMFGGVPAMAVTLKPMLISFAVEIGNLLTEKFDPTEVISVEKIRAELNSLMTDKLQLLTPDIVKKMMEGVIRQHLGWLVVWGNIMGGIIGVVSAAVGYGN